MKKSKPLLAIVFIGLIGIAVYFFISRQMQPTLAEKLADEIEQVATNGNEQIDIANLTNFTWDSLYIFAPYSTPEQINHTLGFTWSEASPSAISLHDDISLLIFVNNGRVVEDVEFRRVGGDFAEAASSEPYTPDQASFAIDSSDGIKLMPAQLTTQGQ
jgi:hypothetical protein